MENRPVWFGRIRPGNAPISGAIASPAWTFGIAPKQSFLSAIISRSRIRKGKFAIARRARQHPRRARYLMRLRASNLRASCLLWPATDAYSFTS